MENEGVNKKIVHFEKHKGRNHDAEGIEVELSKKDYEKVGHLSVESKSMKSETTTI